MSRRLSKANSITTYDTATLWRALEASSVNHQNRSSQKDNAHRWQRAANRLLRQNTVTTISSHNNEHSSPTHAGFAGTSSSGGGGGGSGLINSVLRHFLLILLTFAIQLEERKFSIVFRMAMKNDRRVISHSFVENVKNG